MNYLAREMQLLATMLTVCLLLATGTSCIDKPKPIEKDDAMDVLITALGDRYGEGIMIVSSGEDEIYGVHCRKFQLGVNTPEKFTAEDHFAVTDDGRVFILDISRGEYMPYNIENIPQKIVALNTQGMEEITPDVEYSSDMLYVSIEPYYPWINDKEYDSNTILARIKILEGDNIRVKSVTYENPSEYDCGDQCFVKWFITYETGENGDTMYCSDVYFRDPSGEYRVHVMTPINYVEIYSTEIKDRLNTIVLLNMPEIDTSDLEQLNDLGTEYQDSAMYIHLQSLSPFNGDIGYLTEENIPIFIKILEGNDIRELKVANAPEELHTSFPTWIATYETGKDEDVVSCTDICYSSDTGNYRIHTSTPLDKADQYRDRIIKRLIASWQ